MKLGIPAKYGVRLPIGVDVKRDYAEYHSSYKFEPGQHWQLSSLRKMKILMTEIPYERRDDYASFRRTVEADQAQSITLDNKSPGTAGLGAGQSPDDLFDSACRPRTTTTSRWPSNCSSAWRKPIPSTRTCGTTSAAPTWLTINTRRRPTLSRSRLTPMPTTSTHTLIWGRRTKACRRYDDAIVQYQKAIEVSPLDVYAHGSLGLLYSKLKRWNEAVPELEKAASLQDKNPLLQISLGQAYIATGQTDKGMAAFERAIAVVADRRGVEQHRLLAGRAGRATGARQPVFRRRHQCG